jgi:SAM-dependent methyltransferase
VVRVEPGVSFGRELPMGDALIVTNDLSPHMFSLAGLWGLPTREDGTRLTRTFHEGSVDGVLLGYGTHHIPDMFAAAREAGRTVRPGGRVVVHDFFDEGPAGQWFHRVVDERSITGHDFPHVGPLQMAAVLLRAGLRDVRLHEIQDPFLFACDEGTDSAPRLALEYIAGMYGLAPGFPDGLGEMKDAIDEILTYPDVGEVPTFGEDFVYIPRRAVVATAVRPRAGEAPRSEGDRALVRRISELFRSTPEALIAELEVPEEVHRYWFTPCGRWWGITPAEQSEWLAWAEGLDGA